MEANNTKKLREEVDLLLTWAEGVLGLSPDLLKEGTRECCKFVVMCCKDALAEPPRQCDMGTAEEQKNRFVEYCKNHRIKLTGHSDVCNPKCPCRKGGDLNLCTLTWAQMLCTEKEDNKKTGDNHGIE